jgi:DNA-binding HxlR family transcriptional regulator
MLIKPYACGLEAALALLDGKWKPLILRTLFKGPARYSDLRRTVAGISDKVLIQHLKELEADLVVVRTDFREIPPRVEYSLTEFGSSLIETLTPLCKWGKQKIDKIGDQGSRQTRDGGWVLIPDRASAAGFTSPS